MKPDLMDLFIWWLLSMIAAATIVGARIGNWLYGEKAPPPPLDATMLRDWKRRRMWIIISETSALPAFASLSVAATYYWSLDPWISIPIAMLLAILGFLLLLDAVQRTFYKKMGIAPAEKRDEK
jgi:hypothetical protein